MLQLLDTSCDFPFCFVLNITLFKSALGLIMYLPFPVKDEGNNLSMIVEAFGMKI